jgi:hypothetical protein
VQHHYEGHWKGWALKIETFLGPEMARAERVPFGPKKVVLLCVVVCKRGGEVSLKLCCVRRYSGVGGGWQASPSPFHYSVGIQVSMDACSWGRGGAIVT